MFHRNTKTLVALLTSLTFSLMVQRPLGKWRSLTVNQAPASEHMGNQCTHFLSTFMRDLVFWKICLPS